MGSRTVSTLSVLVLGRRLSRELMPRLPPPRTASLSRSLGSQDRVGDINLHRSILSLENCIRHELHRPPVVNTLPSTTEMEQQFLVPGLSSSHRRLLNRMSECSPAVVTTLHRYHRTITTHHASLPIHRASLPIPSHGPSPNRDQSDHHNRQSQARQPCRESRPAYSHRC